MKQLINPYPNVRQSLVFISPERAMELLANNKANQRPISRSNLTKIVRDMERGSFVLNGQPIILSTSGEILDGQHRLTASMNTKVGFWTTLVEGIESEYFSKIDIGKVRTLPVALRIMGKASAGSLAVTLQRLAEYMWDPTMVGLGVPFSDTEKLDALAGVPRLEESVAYCRSQHIDRTVPVASVAWLHYVTQQYVPLTSNVFFEKLATGAMLPEDSPIYLLRARLLAAKSAKSKLPLRHALALLIKAWNAHVAGVSLKTLRWSETEAFPRVSLPAGEASGPQAVAS
jgi:hypothetical protein